MSKKYEEQKFKTDIGINALVQREDVPSEVSEKANQILRSLGRDLLQLEIPNCKWIGSAALHIYTAPTLGFIQTITQAHTLDDCPEIVAAKSIAEFNAAVKAYYGQRSSKLRSGHY